MTLSFGSSCEFRYTNADCIGQGAFGIVFLAAVTERGTFSGEDAVAVKVIQMGKDNPLLQTLENWEKFLQRSQKLLELQHSHLVRYHKLSITDTPHGGKVVDFVMDHCNGGDLALFLKDLKTKNLKLDYTDVIRFSMEITAGLQFLHANEIIHGDLKPANIFLKRRNDGQHTLLIGDLDDYVQMHKPVTTARDIPQYRGTVRYMSPEMLQKYTCQGDEVIGRKTDVWSIGCIIAEMSNSSAWDFGNCLCNWSTRELFQIQDSTPNQIFIDKILNGFVPYIQKSDAGVMDSCVASCFSRQAEDRTSAGMLLQKIRGFGTKRFPGRLLEVATIHLNARKTIPVGMDLGKSYSCVAAFIDGKVITIPNDQGNRMTPSVVCFVAGDRLVGESAAMCRCESLTNTICDVKLMIGRSFDDPLIQTDIANWDFRVAEKNGKFNIVVEENGEDMLLTPEQVNAARDGYISTGDIFLKEILNSVQVTAMILYNMKDSAEIFLQSTICDVVLTVPVYFTNAQRQATKDAATIAGLNVLAMINEPTAAAMYLGTETKIKRNQKILMLRLGSSTLSISILIKEPNEHFTVVASHRNPHLGGNDFVDALTRILAEEYDQQHQEKLAHDPEAVERLREACKHSKKILDYGFDRKIVLSNFTGGKSYQRIVTRTEYETVCKDLFSSILAQVQATLRTAHLTVADIEHVALVGKSSRVPKVKELLQQLFIGKNVKDSAAPDEVVACGAAVYAASLMGHNICKKDSEDVNSLDP